MPSALATPPIPCQGGQVIGGQCVCPEGQNLQNGQCVPGVVIDCAPGSIRQGSACIQCPPGLSPSGGRCVASLPPGSAPPTPPPQGSGPQSIPTFPAFPPAPNPPPGSTLPEAQQAGDPVITCTGGTVQNLQCICPPRWTRETIAIAPGGQVYNCRPPPAQ